MDKRSCTRNPGSLQGEVLLLGDNGFPATASDGSDIRYDYSMARLSSTGV